MSHQENDLKTFTDQLGKSLASEEARYVYADTVTNAFVSAQIKALREDRGLSQDKLAELIGTKQSGISRLERADYSSWKIETLRKLARAFEVRLRISFEEFGTLLPDLRGFTTKRLTPRSFADDPVFRKADKGAEVAVAPMRYAVIGTDLAQRIKAILEERATDFVSIGESLCVPGRQLREAIESIQQPFQEALASAFATGAPANQASIPKTPPGVKRPAPLPPKSTGQLSRKSANHPLAGGSTQNVRI